MEKYRLSKGSTDNDSEQGCATAGLGDALSGTSNPILDVLLSSGDSGALELNLPNQMPL